MPKDVTDERAERRDRRRQSEREMKKHGARTAAIYSNAVLKRRKTSPARKRAGR